MKPPPHIKELRKLLTELNQAHLQANGILCPISPEVAHYVERIAGELDTIMEKLHAKLEQLNDSFEWID